ncbi:MAG: 1-acyl-sn-glycerol-3-phosphate acyltransferase [Ferrovum myxofaciens]|uniref:lysophospholipid acyltransferase family protein n=2 Tax=Ferrovum myxofaciens TaxID=416213 RepID=UPI003EBF1EF7|nr:MAG: 1-acyl-sn-glycerol-3-phosphate acyltransferase [Ferrovum myxofaciens]
MSMPLRILGLLGLILRGILTTALVLPWCSRARRRRLICHWSRRLLQYLRLTIQVQGAWPDSPGPYLLTSNHISWVDIFVIHSVHPVRFISKSEVRHWPIFGWLAARTGTLFLSRSSRRQTLEIGKAMTQVLQAGDDLGFFPESTTSDGTSILPFKTSLLQSPLDCQATLLPIALRYSVPPGHSESAYPFIGDMTFMESLVRVLKSPPSQVTLSLGTPHKALELGTDRRQLALQLHLLTQQLRESM